MTIDAPALRRLDRGTRWQLESSVEVQTDGAHVDTPAGVRIRCIVDDRTAAIATWVARP